MMYSSSFVFIHVPRTGGTILTDEFGWLETVSKDVHSLKHATASELQNIIEPELWESAYKFSIYRSDDEIAASWYRHLKYCFNKHNSGDVLGVTQSWIDFVAEASQYTFAELCDRYPPPTMAYYLDVPGIDVISLPQARDRLRELCGLSNSESVR